VSILSHSGWKNEKRPSDPIELDLEAGNLVVDMMWKSLLLLLAIGIFAGFSDALTLLDPATGRVIELNFPGNRRFDTNAKFTAGSASLNSNDLKNIDRKSNRRSDYVSDSGTPLYKLRKRNPFGFGG